jgi:hypothetical protein
LLSATSVNVTRTQFTIGLMASGLDT